MPKLREEDQMFNTKMNGETVWVIEDGQAFTLLIRLTHRSLSLPLSADLGEAARA